MRVSLKTLALTVSLAGLAGPSESREKTESPPVSAGSCPALESAHVRARWIMGTLLEIRLWLSPEEANLAADAVFQRTAKIEQAASTWRRDSELETIHRAAGEPREVSAELAGVLEAALAASSETGGLFSPFLGSLIAAYDLHGAGRWPTLAQRASALRATMRENLSWDPETRRLTLAEGMKLDLDGIAKGYALDRAREELRLRGIDTFHLNFGGQILAGGPPEGCRPWSVQILEPGSSRRVLEIGIRDMSVSTSANSERVRLVNGREQGHLLDPGTGKIVASRGSVTVAARSASVADALSTAALVAERAGRATWRAGLVARHPELEFAFVEGTSRGEVSISATAGFEMLVKK